MNKDLSCAENLNLDSFQASSQRFSLDEEQQQLCVDTA